MAEMSDPHTNAYMLYKQSVTCLWRTLVASWILMSIQNCSLGCNIDTREPFATFDSNQHNQPGSYFGYTVLQHFTNGGGWCLIIGAPRGSSVDKPNVQQPGTIFRCKKTTVSTNCDEIPLSEPSGTRIVDHADFGWMGVTLTRQSITPLADVTVCGHRFGNDIALQPNANLSDPKVDRYVQGICYTLDPELSQTQVRFSPCAEREAWKDGVIDNESLRWQGWCQFGMSATYTIETDTQTLVVGAVGSFNWTGTTFSQEEDRLPQMSAGNLSDWNKDYSHNDFYQYVGYSTSVGHFMSLTSQEGVTGAPRAGGLVGRVYVYDLKNFAVFQELSGEMMNTYFGGALEAIDINNDGLTDLLVGAPLYSTDRDEGRVYVYMNRGGSSPLQLHQTIDATSTPGSRFGQVITSTGDLNTDGYEDVAIGAPYEGGGVVYIYQGTIEGIDLAYSQRINGTEIDSDVQAFGSAISGGFDFDANTYPDIAIGAYATDSVYLYKTRPLLDLVIDLTVSPDPMDPENPTCSVEGKGTCLEINVCFSYVGPSPAALPDSIEVIYDVEIDKVKTSEALKPRFLLEKDDQMLPKLDETKTIFKDRDTCFNYTAYQQSTATDFLTALPVDVTYILMEYAVEPPPRGDIPQRFPSGLSPVMKSYQCAALIKMEEVNFVRDCGADAVCETDIRLKGNVEVEGNPTELIVGGSSKLYINARVDNVGEEAHQAFLTIRHVTDMRYEGLEDNEVSCISSDGSDRVDSNCNVGQMRVTCEPSLVNLDVSIVTCNLGNPMKAFTSSTLRLRFDIGGLIWASNRDISITMEASTSSIQRNETMQDNRFEVTYPLVIEADVGIFGTTAPESVYYSSNSSRYADDASAMKALNDAVNMALAPDPSSTTFNDTYIGASFSMFYTLTNTGPGLLPFQSVLVVNIPWRMLDGNWLIFIKRISVSDRTSNSVCNSDDILALQNTRLIEFYVDKTNSLSTELKEDVVPIFNDAESDQQMGCSKAKCVSLTCQVGALQAGHSIELRIDALQWEHTFITRSLGYVEIVSEAGVVAKGDPSEHRQGDDEEPNEIKLLVKMFTDKADAGNVPIWVYIVSILGGIILLILCILLLWKCGFFKRKTRDDWIKDVAEPTTAQPMPIKPVVSPGDDLEGADLPMMKGLAAKE